MKGDWDSMDGATSGINPMLDPKGAGAALLRQGKFGEAAAVLKEAAAMTPDDEETFSLLGAALASSGDSTLSVDAFKKAAELGPTNPRNHFNLGLAYQAGNRLSEARSAFERAVNLNPGYEAARAKLSEVAQKMGGPSASPVAAPQMQTTNIVGGGDSSMLRSVGAQYTPPASEGTSNIQAGGDASSLASIGQQANATPAQNAAQAAEQAGHTNISGGSGAGYSLSSVGTGRAPVVDTGTTNIGGGATAATPPPSAAPVLRQAPPGSVGPSSAAPSYTPPSAPGTYAPPAPMLGMNYATMENSSGMQGDVPAEIAGGFNWGAFFLGWIWLICMRMTAAGIALLIGPAIIGGVLGGIVGGVTASGGNVSNMATAMAPLRIGLYIVQFGVALYLGIAGNKLAWKNRRFDSIEDFKACQRIWGWWGLGVFIAGLVIGFLLVLVFGVLLAAALTGTGAAGGRKF